MGLVGETVDVEDVPLLGRIAMRVPEPMILGKRWEIFGTASLHRFKTCTLMPKSALVCASSEVKHSCCERVNVRGWVGLPCCALWVDKCVGSCEYAR